MTRTGSELIVDIFDELSITRIFGNPGTTELPLINTISKSPSIKYIQTLHEDIAVGIASGYAQRISDYKEDTLPISVVNVHTTPGLLHSLGNIYNSKFSNTPLIITTGSQDPHYEDKNPMLNGNRQSSIDDYIKWSRTVRDANNLPYVFRRATREALTHPRGPVYIDIPITVQKQNTTETPRELGTLPEIGAPNRSNIQLAVEQIQKSKKPLIIVGDHVSSESSESKQIIKKLANKINAPVYGEIMLSTESYPMTDSNWMGTLGANESLNDITYTYDLIIQIGSSMNKALLQEDQSPPRSPLIEISSDQSHLQYSEYSTVSLLGHIGETVDRINGSIQATNIDRDLSSYKEQRKQKFKKISQSTNNPSKIERYELAEAIRKNLTSNNILIDEGVTTGFILRNLLRGEPQKYQGTKGGGLGEGLPLAIGYAIADQEYNKNTKIITLLGDGAFQYYPQSLYNISKYNTNPLHIIISNNNGYEILKNPEKDNQTELNISNIDISKIAEGYNIQSMKLSDKTNLKEKLRQILSKEYPTITEILTD